jgi:anthranilate phosphoribosyltransferase
MIKEAIQKLVDGKSLTLEEASTVMEEIMDGQVAPSQFGSFVTALRMKGETVEEIAGLARIMRARALHVKGTDQIVDTCGTGGDGAGTFNVSTTAAFIAAGAGVKVAKHGNRAMSSKSGSADVLEALGVKIELKPDQVQRCLEDVGIGFMFAPAFHPSMKYATGPRREIGIRTVFNILGPLTNPAGANKQVIGVPTEEVGHKMARALALLGSPHSLIVHGIGGIDELSISGKSRVWELSEDRIVDYYVSPEDMGFKPADTNEVKGGTAQENAVVLRKVLEGEKGPRREMSIMNAAAAIMVAKNRHVNDGTHGIRALNECAREAESAIDSGNASAKLAQLVSLSKGFVE